MNEQESQTVGQRVDGSNVLESKPDLRGPAEPLDGPGDPTPTHLGFVYETKQEQFATVAPYIQEGLERGEQCTYVFAENSRAEVLAALRERGVDVDAALDSGQLSLRSVEEAYLDAGEFDVDESLAFLRNAVADALEEYDGFRVTAEETWLRGDEATQDAFMRFEARVNDLLGEAVALCQYDRTRLPPRVIEAVIETHPYLVYDGTICGNVYYTPPEEYFEPADLARDNGRKLETLVDRTDARVSLRTRNRFQQRLYDVVSRPERSFDEKLGALFELGCEFFDMELGAMARVDTEEDRLEIEAASDDHEHVRPGAEFDLSETYCTAAAETEGTASVSNACEEGYGEIAAREQLGFESYLGSFVTVTGDDDRTFFFVSTEPREAPITDEEHTLHNLMAQWVGNELERRRRERETELFRNLVDQSNDGVFVIDPGTGRFLDVNETACRRLGYDRAELLELSVADVTKEVSDPDAWRRDVHDVEAAGGTTFEGTHERKDGTTYPVEVNASFVEQDREYLVGIARDVSEREERERFQRELYEATSASDRSFDEKLDRVLELGCERFDLPYGFLTRIDDDVQTVVRSQGDHERLQPGRACPLGRTYCRQTLRSDGLVSVREATAEGWDGDPAHETFGLETYVGASVVVDGELYGTLCFASRRRRDRPFTDAERTYLELIGQWVSHELERERREDQLAALNEMSRDLMLAETPTQIAASTVEHARETLRLPLSAVVYYDKQTGSLSPAAQTPRAEAELPTAALCDRESGPLWEAFVAEESRTASDVATEAGSGGDSDGVLAEVVAVPLGQQGLFVTATGEPNGFSDAERSFVETAAATVEAASTRAKRRRQLQEREETLEEQNDTLERLNRINTIIRNIDQGLVRASTRAEIEEVVCEHLADVGPYELAWIGEYDSVADEIDHREWAGAEQGYFEEIAAISGEAGGTGPGGRAVQSREPEVVNDVLDDPSFEPWRQAAINRGYHSFAVLPLVYEDTLYGLIGVYAGRPGVFDELEQSVLADMARTIAYAINAIESKKALVSDEVTELEFAVDDTDLEIVALARELDCEFAMESIVPQADGRFRVFFSTRGAPVEDVLEFESRLPSTNLTLVAEREEGEEPFGLFESTLQGGSLCTTTIEHGGQPCDVRVVDGTATVTVELAADADVRKFVRMFRTNYPDSELVSQRTEGRPKRTRMEVSNGVAEALTARQLEVLQTAYYSGYFEEPRRQGAREIAAAMDIAQSTFSSHIRAAHRKVCSQLFDEGPLLA